MVVLMMKIDVQPRLFDLSLFDEAICETAFPIQRAIDDQLSGEQRRHVNW